MCSLPLVLVIVATRLQEILPTKNTCLDPTPTCNSKPCPDTTVIAAAFNAAIAKPLRQISEADLAKHPDYNAEGLVGITEVTFESALVGAATVDADQVTVVCGFYRGDDQGRLAVFPNNMAGVSVLAKLGPREKAATLTFNLQLHFERTRFDQAGSLGETKVRIEEAKLNGSRARKNSKIEEKIKTLIAATRFAIALNVYDAMQKESAKYTV